MLGTLLHDLVQRARQQVEVVQRVGRISRRERDVVTLLEGTG